MFTNIIVIIALLSIAAGIFIIALISALNRKDLKAMRRDIRAEFESLRGELTELTEASDGILKLVAFQNEKLKDLANSEADAEEIKAALRDFTAEVDVQQNRLVNAALSGTGAEPAEPLPEPELPPIEPEPEQGGEEQGD